jgi:CO/xanthine dehydrogenase Mo-binding subunit
MSTTANRWRERPSERLEQRLAIERDGTIIVRSGKVEYGQGIRTGFAKIVAGELAVPIEKVRVELGETDRVPWDMGTFGSMSTATDGRILRAAAVLAHKLLLERAAKRFAVTVSELSISGGAVLARDGRSVGYQDLVAGEPLTGIIQEDEATDRGVLPPTDSPLRLEALGIVTGKARYSGDVRLPNMLRGHVLHAPVRGSRVAAVDDHVARELPGIVAVIRGPDFVGVVAHRQEEVIAAIGALRVEWERPVAVSATPVDAVLRRDPNVEAAFEAAPRHFSAEYHVPHISHAPIGPSVSVADVRDDGADLYVTTQRPFALREDVAQLLGVAPEKVHVHPQMMSGTYGRGNMSDAAIDAVRLSQAVNRPVLVQWTRDEEFRFSPHRPTLEAEISAALNPDGTIAAWWYHTRTNPHTYGGTGAALPPGVLEMTSGRNAVPPYRLGSAEVLLRVEPAAIRTGAFRSLAAAPNVFVIESFIDELAHGAGQDPIAFRLRHIEDERLRRVVTAVREKSRWDERPRASGRGFGVACAIYHGTYIAEVAEITEDAAGQIHVERVWCAVDAGRLVHPDGARNQIEGGIQQAASWTLFEELQVHEGEVTTASFQDYRIATFHDAIREIDIQFIPAQQFPSTGAGEPGSVPMAAAIANAVFEACGVRVRRLPLTPEAIAAARRQGLGRTNL